MMWFTSNMHSITSILHQLFILIVVHQSVCTTAKKPHIIFIVADDLGWNDLEIRNPDMVTPCIKQAALSGIILNSSYVQPVCTPSRSSFLTGYYPYRTGMQESVIPLFGPFGLPLQFKLLPQVLKEQGYHTNLVGKWHLGSCHEKYLPTNRGFDTYFGILGGGEHYSSHSYPLTNENLAISRPGLPEIYDFWNQTTPQTVYNGTYSSIPMIRQIQHILETKNPNSPLFLYWGLQAPHSPIEAPEDQQLWYPRVQNRFRSRFSALVSQLDQDFGQLIQQLKAYKIYDNSIIIFTTDNGASTSSGGNNFPLRGAKGTMYEGGTRASAFIHSPLLKSTGYTYNGLIHAVDWFPTIIKLAGGTPGTKIDGIDVWNAITSNIKSPRTGFVYNLLERVKGNFNGAIRDGDWKLIFGDAGLPNTIIKPNDVTGETFDACGGNYTPDPNPAPFQLYNIKNDPTESNNLVQNNATLVKTLYDKVKKLALNMVKATFLPNNINLYRNRTQNLRILNTNWCTPINNVTVT
ncbi:Arylsulfatase [Chamberlinius hualienensis]